MKNQRQELIVSLLVDETFSKEDVKKLNNRIAEFMFQIQGTDSSTNQMSMTLNL